MPTRRDWARPAAALVLAAVCSAAPQQSAACCDAKAMSPEATALRGKHDILRGDFANSPFKRPLVVQSSDSNDELKGEVYAIVDHPFKTTLQVLQDKSRWCEVVMLHQNVKQCRAGAETPKDRMAIVIGRKAEHSPAQGYKMDFTFNVDALTADYVRVQMSAREGPMSTRDHRVMLQAAPLDAQRSLIHLSYGYSFGGVARMATQAYMTTAGRDKVGFTITGKTKEGDPVFINGVRGMVERNAMRYFLAIEAYFGAMSAPSAQQQEKRLQDWFALTEEHPRQLHEMERHEYLANKRRDLATP
ncbi:MAG TPA: hypothetical protein VFO28_11150 [Burkholderiaceae bacterium]|nr:hypothetical protein [Burkholderiaceae bacterium]